MNPGTLIALLLALFAVSQAQSHPLRAARLLAVLMGVVAFSFAAMVVVAGMEMNGEGRLLRSAIVLVVLILGAGWAAALWHAAPWALVLLLVTQVVAAMAGLISGSLAEMSVLDGAAAFATSVMLMATAYLLLRGKVTRAAATQPAEEHGSAEL